MKRRLFCCLLAAMLLIGSLPAAQAASTSTPKVSVQTVSATAGDEVSVTVTLSGNTGFSDLSIELDYDPAILTLVQAEQEALTSNCRQSQSQHLTDRPYSLIWVSGTSLCKANGTLATLTFRISEDAPSGDTPVSVSFYKGRQGNNEDGVNVNYQMDANENQTPLGLTYASGSVNVKAMPDTEVTVSLGGGRQAALSARHPMTGQIYIASYTGEGRMLGVSIRDAAGTVSAVPASGAACVRLMWLDGCRPVCASQQITL